MPRSPTAVKTKLQFQAPGAVDLHFHGAFGIDLMTADERALDALSRRLWKAGLAGFLATTLSAPRDELLATLARLGAWIRRGRFPGAIPLGIHLEGPFLSPRAAGAHPPGVIRPVTLAELRELDEAGHRTLKLITLAPESQDPAELRRVLAWAKRRGVRLALGHSRATRAEAKRAFDAGFTGVTHAWNALAFHHREPGALGAALGRRGLHLELIVDGIHVDPTLIRWTRSLHPRGTCFVSDCAPAAGLPAGRACAFGPLTIELRQGAARLADGSLAGGGRLLPDAIGRWVAEESRETGIDAGRLLREAIRHSVHEPLTAIGLRPSVLRDRQVRWNRGPAGRWRARPI